MSWLAGGGSAGRQRSVRTGSGQHPELGIRAKTAAARRGADLGVGGMAALGADACNRVKYRISPLYLSSAHLSAAWHRQQGNGYDDGEKLVAWRGAGFPRTARHVTGITW